MFKDVEVWTRGERLLWEPYLCVCVCVCKQRKEFDTEGYCCISSLSSCLAAENQRRRLVSGLVTSTSLSALTVTAAVLSSHPCQYFPTFIAGPFPFFLCFFSAVY